MGLCGINCYGSGSNAGSGSFASGQLVSETYLSGNTSATNPLLRKNDVNPGQEIINRVKAGTNVTVVPNEAEGSITINAVGGSGNIYWQQGSQANTIKVIDGITNIDMINTTLSNLPDATEDGQPLSLGQYNKINYWGANQAGEIYPNNKVWTEGFKGLILSGNDGIPQKVYKMADGVDDSDGATVKQAKSWNGVITQDTVAKNWTYVPGWNYNGAAGGFNLTTDATGNQPTRFSQVNTLLTNKANRINNIDTNFNNFGELNTFVINQVTANPYAVGVFNGEWSINDGTTTITNTYQATFSKNTSKNLMMYNFEIACNDIGWMPTGGELIPNIDKIQYVLTVDIPSGNLETVTMLVMTHTGNLLQYTLNDNIGAKLASDNNTITIRTEVF